ncbi:MAG TPA: hypothetical protein VHZ26_00870 [Caulobacteraceae bacterium]|jgi:FtsH-binding integral membrane protein|nr:hypothetical protein [Caulobacteraceae bacterium]
MATRLSFSSLSPTEPSGPGRSTPAMLFAVFGAPLAWSVEIAVDAAIACYPCASQGTLWQTLPVGWTVASSLLWAVNIAAILVAAAATAAAFSALRGAPRSEPRPTAVFGERLSRTHYLAVWGVLNGFGFLAALLFDSVMILGTPAQC